MIAYDQLSLIIPPDQALANKALQAAMQQVTGIGFANLKDFAGSVKNLNTTKDLPLVQALTQALPTAIYQYYINTFSGNYGTGPNGTITLVDVLGAVAGLPYTAQYNSIVGIVTKLYQTGQLTSLISIYQTMLNTVDGVYGSEPVVIPSGPAAGTYVDYDTAFSGNSPLPGIGLIPAAQAAINTIISNNISYTSSMNVNSNTIAESVVRENTNQARAQIIWGDLIANDQSSLLAFVSNLTSYSQDTAQGGAVEILENMANVTSLGGQAIIGTLREGRNIDVLSAANIDTATQVDPEPANPPPSANLIDSIYSVSEAKQKLIF